jgi:hypothetical protein
MTTAKTGLTAGERLVLALRTDPLVASLVGDRIFPNELPAQTQLPAIVYSVVSDVPENSFDGTPATRLCYCRVQVDSYARPAPQGRPGAYATAQRVARAVDDVLGNLQQPGDVAGLREASRDLFDSVTGYHRVSSDFALWL